MKSYYISTYLATLSQSRLPTPITRIVIRSKLFSIYDLALSTRENKEEEEEEEEEEERGKAKKRSSTRMEYRAIIANQLSDTDDVCVRVYSPSPPTKYNIYARAAFAETE
jgi:hypothetical protein